MYYDTSMRIAIQGQAGSFHEQAARKQYGSDIEIVPCDTFGDVFRTYREGKADAIIVAVENTIHGTINESYRQIEDCTAPITSEVTLRISQNLATLPEATLPGITKVYSHPVALSQCQKFLQDFLPHASQIEFFDTAGAVEFVKQQQNPQIAAIASAAAADLYNLPILRTNIQDSDDNLTRFLVLDPNMSPKNPNRASLVVTTAHHAGSLAEVLQIFARQNINLASLHSQPIAGQPWKYKFFLTVDAAGNRLHQAIDEVRSTGHNVTILGEYKSSC